ncbi:MAG TPA: hypothetical protein VGD71_12230 [Kribbella sp.]
MNVYQFIEAEKQRSATDGTGGGNVARACGLLKLSRSAYYAHAAALAAGGTARQREDAELTVWITEIHADSGGSCRARVGVRRRARCPASASVSRSAAR